MTKRAHLPGSAEFRVARFAVYLASVRQQITARPNMTRFVVASLTVVMIGCGSESSVPLPANAHTDTIHMSLAWEIAPGQHADSDSLGQVSGVAVDRAGNVYVTDFLAAKIWVFDSDGRLLTSIGRKGQGPGEFEAPTGPAIGPDGRLYVRDVYRVSVFGIDSISGLLTRIERTFDGPVYADWTSTRATRFDETGAILYPGTRWREDGTGSLYVIRFSPVGDPIDTIIVPEYATAPQLTAWMRTGPGGGRMLPGLNHVPFAPLPVWDVAASGNVISGDGRTYELVVTNRGGAVLARLHRSLPLDRIPPDVHRDSVAALRSRLDSIPVPVSQVEGLPETVRSLKVPDRYPAYMAVHVANDGDIWVRRWPVGGSGQTIFDVFDQGGTYQCTVVLPREIRVEPTPILSLTSVVGVAAHPLTDESMVIRFTENGSE
jgi:hypothetical protein